MPPPTLNSEEPENTHFSPAKAMTVSDNHAARSYKSAPQKTRMQFDWVKFQ